MCNVDFFSVDLVVEVSIYIYILKRLETHWLKQQYYGGGCVQLTASHHQIFMFSERGALCRKMYKCFNII